MSKFIDKIASGFSRAALVLAAGAALSVPTKEAWADTDHVALVIGNQNYQYAPALVNPVDDAKAIAKKLGEDLHFDVVTGYDVNDATLRADLRDFREKAKLAKVALVYYAGHGVAYDNENYLLPVDINPKDADDLDLSALTVSDILKQMRSENRVNIVILDACRDNPFPRQLAHGGRGFADRGLSPMNQAQSRGALIVYSTNPNDTAQDGAPGQHSPFAQALLDHIEDPDIPVQNIMDRVRKEVDDNTHGMQTPWANNALLGDEVKLNPRVARLEPAPVVTPPAQVVAPVPVATPQVAAPVPVVTPMPQAPTSVAVVTPPPQIAAPVPQPSTPAAAGSYVTAAVDPSATPDMSGKWRVELGTTETESNLHLTPAVVKKIQLHLQVIRLFHGAINGNIDDASTRNAIIEWQKKEGVTPTSSLSQGQLDALLAIGPAQPTPTQLQHDVGTTITQNALILSQDEMKEIQLRLLASGYLKGNPSGAFDPATKAAISLFQKDVKAPPTGFLGPFQLQDLFAVTETRYEASLDGDNTESAPATRAPPSAPSHAYAGYHHNSVQRRYYGGNGANPFVQFFNGIGQGFGAGLSNRFR